MPIHQFEFCIMYRHFNSKIMPNVYSMICANMFQSSIPLSEVSKQPNWSGQDVIVNWILDGKSV
jgi:hypothetical protein